MSEATIKSLGAVHTLFQSPLRVLGTYCSMLLQTMEVGHSLERRQLPCGHCRPRRVDTCHRKQHVIFHIPCYPSSSPPGTSWPCTLKKHNKNIISPSCLLPPVPCLTFRSLLHRYSNTHVIPEGFLLQPKRKKGDKTLVMILWNRCKLREQKRSL